MRAYLRTLITEIERFQSRLPEGVELSRLHWGGGTPTLLSPDMIGELAETILARTPLSAAGEFSVEIDPNELDEARIDMLAAAGMTRASIGVQDFDPAIQMAIGREQGYDVTRWAAEALRDRGVESLNTDILYGLPHQTPERIADSVQRLLSLNPDRVALYGYAHVPWMARRQALIPSEALPTPEQRLQLFETARELFEWDGYEEIGIDHFARAGDGLAVAAREGRLRRNFQGYTDDAAGILVGLGASAISRYPQGYVQNAASTGEYTKLIRAGGFAGKRGHAFRGDDLLRARMIEALMCDFRIVSEPLRRRFGASQAQLNALYQQAAAQFPGFVEVTPSGFAIRPEGRPLTRMIARSFDAYDLSTAGHSSAV